MTLPLIYALQKAEKSEKRKILNIIKKDSKKPKKVAEVIDFVKQMGGLEYAEKVMKDFQQQAFNILDEFPENDSRESIRALIRYVSERKK